VDLRGMLACSCSGFHHTCTLYRNQLITVWAMSETLPPTFLGVCRGWFANGFLYGLRSASTPNRAGGD
jgi:hypothetical protein